MTRCVSQIQHYDRCVDFHGFRLLDAEIDIHLIIGAAKASQNTEIVQFITGHGAIREMLERILKEYDIGYAEKLGNSGVIIAEIE